MEMNTTPRPYPSTLREIKASAVFPNELKMEMKTWLKSAGTDEYVYGSFFKMAPYSFLPRASWFLKDVRAKIFHSIDFLKIFTAVR